MRHKNPNQTDKDFLQLKGNIKQVMQTVYKAVLENGSLVPGKIEVDHGTIEKNFIFTFNNEGNIVEEDIYGTHFRSIKKYDLLGQMIEEIKYYNGDLYEITSITYNDKPFQVDKRITTDALGHLKHRTEHTYTPDTQQQLLLISYHIINGKEVVLYKNEYTYRDEVITINNIPMRKQLTSISYDREGKFTHKFINTYNEKGFLIENTTEFSNSKHMNRRTTYKHNEQGDVIETNMYNAIGTLEHSFVAEHQYDSDGKKILPPPPAPYISYPGPFMLFTEGDEVDEIGNWIKKITKPPSKYITRTLVYDGEEKTLEHPLLNIENVPKETEREIDSELYKLEEEEAKWIANIPGASGDNFPIYRYYTQRFKAVPSMITYEGPNIEAMALLKMLREKLSADLVHTFNTVWDGNANYLQRYTINFSSNWGYMLQCMGIRKQNVDEFLVPDELENKDSEYVYISHFCLYHPSEVSGARDENFEQDLSFYIDKCSLQKKPEKPVINIIEVQGNNFSMTEYAVNDNFIIKDLDINYGQGFEKFHNELMLRFNKSTKGLVLFHGEPGTGKTYYIRHLLRKMVANRKIVIYIPPNMVDHLADPSFMTFLSSQLKSWSQDGFFCVLLIEDAEPLLAKRQEGVRIQGVTNLLNMTDGLLNDMLNLQIICTFNVDLSKLDSALLRPGRLIARKEFKPLSELDANLLAQRLGIKHHFTKPASLGEIYALQKNQHTLVHDVEVNKNTSSTIDDF